MRIFILLVFFSIVVGCGGGGGQSSPPLVQQDDAIVGEQAFDDQLPIVVLSESMKVIDPNIGGTIELDGATLVIPPNALLEEATIGLIKTTLPALSVPSENLALRGYKLSSYDGFALISDKILQLSSPLKLNLPINSELASEKSTEQQFELVTDFGGVIIPQGLNGIANNDNTAVEFTLASNNTQTVTLSQQPTEIMGMPIQRSIPIFFALGIGWNIHPLVAAYFEPLGHNGYVTPHFRLLFPEDSLPDTVDPVVLERARSHLVDDLGFQLPNYFNFDDRYTVVYDEFSGADGFTMPGSSLFEGASWVTPGRSKAQTSATAVHEYAHAVQYGVTPWLTLTTTEAALHPESVWLFEGSAVSLAGRILSDDISSASLDRTLTSRINMGMSLYDPEQGTSRDDPLQPPATDVTRDLFYYVERLLGHNRFHKKIFERLGSTSDGVIINRSVSAFDSVLREESDGQYTIQTVWEQFVQDYWINNFGGYTDFNSFTKLALESEYGLFDRYDLPALSFQVIELVVPRLSKDDLGNTVPGQSKDVLIRTQPTQAGGEILVHVVGPQLSTPETRLLHVHGNSNDQAEFTIENYRGDRQKSLFVVVSNSATSPLLESTQIRISGRLVSEPNTLDIVQFEASTVSGEGSTTVNYSVFGGEQPYELEWEAIDAVNSEGQSPNSEFSNSFQYTESGTFTISLRVTDTAGEQVSEQLIVVIDLPEPPIPQMPPVGIGEVVPTAELCPAQLGSRNGIALDLVEFTRSSNNSHHCRYAWDNSGNISAPVIIFYTTEMHTTSRPRTEVFCTGTDGATESILIGDLSSNSFARTRVGSNSRQVQIEGLAQYFSVQELTSILRAAVLQGVGNSC